MCTAWMPALTLRVCDGSAGASRALVPASIVPRDGPQTSSVTVFALARREVDRLGHAAERDVDPAGTGRRGRRA